MHLANEDLNIVLGDGTFTKNFLNCHDDFDFFLKRNAHKTNLCNVNNALIKTQDYFKDLKKLLIILNENSMMTFVLLIRFLFQFQYLPPKLVSFFLCNFLLFMIR